MSLSQELSKFCITAKVTITYLNELVRSVLEPLKHVLEVNPVFYVSGEIILLLETLIANISLLSSRQSIYCKARACFSSCFSPDIFEILKTIIFLWKQISTIDFFVTINFVFQRTALSIIFIRYDAFCR